MRSVKRREFLKLAAAGALVACSRSDELETYVEGLMSSKHMPGIAGCLVQNGEVLRELSLGYADIERNIPMTLDTLQNIASISKTFTTTAIMQLWEQEAFRLDDDVNDLLPFKVHAQAPITVRQLLTHTSSIADGTSYPANYACGDSDIPLGTWLEEYFTPGGRFYDAGEVYHEWAPGDRFSYSNVAFGLLAYIVEVLSGDPFEDYCSRHIFEPLGMSETSWHLAEIDTSKHAIPYAWVVDGEPRAPIWGGSSVIGTQAPQDGYAANCLYSHPNYPDGFLRTSVRQLLQFAMAYLRGGEPILLPGTVNTILQGYTDEVVDMGETWVWGLGWFMRKIDGQPVWGHNGGDPGVNTVVELKRDERKGAIVFSNTFIDDYATDLRDISARLLSGQDYV